MKCVRLSGGEALGSRLAPWCAFHNYDVQLYMSKLPSLLVAFEIISIHFKRVITNICLSSYLTCTMLKLLSLLVAFEIISKQELCNITVNLYYKNFKLNIKI